MTAERKTRQLQIRVSRSEKMWIEKQARRAGMGISEWVLSRLAAERSRTIQRIWGELAASERPSFALADLHDFVADVSPDEFGPALADAPPARLGPVLLNQIAAMVEVTAHRLGVAPPAWAADIPPLAEPWFASELLSVRLHLLTSSPPPFRRRNLFVDTTVGGRV